MLLSLTDQGIFKHITHYFPVRGHSFLPCDRDFGQIKRLIRGADRIYTIEQHSKLILKSSNANTFCVNIITQEKILNFKSLWSKFYEINCLSNSSFIKSVSRNEKVYLKISKFMEFVYDCSHKCGKVTATFFIGGIHEHTFTFLRRAVNIILPTDIANSRKLSINTKKI